MEYNFEKFSGFNTRSKKSTVSITKAEAIGLSAAFCEEYSVSEYKYAVLYYDSRKNSIGFKLTNDENEKSKFAVTRTNKAKGKSSSIVAHTFFSKNKIKANKYAHKYLFKVIKLRDLKLGESGDMFVFDLKEDAPEID